jgi:hypothetical protein
MAVIYAAYGRGWKVVTQASLMLFIFLHHALRYEDTSSYSSTHAHLNKILVLWDATIFCRASLTLFS